jgi:hypothetical protein
MEFMQLDITPDAANALGFYVYAYIDPRDESVFYIGKGVGARAQVAIQKCNAEIDGQINENFVCHCPDSSLMAHQ